MALPGDQTPDRAAPGSSGQAPVVRERHEGPGQRMTFRTPRGELKGILHRAGGSKQGVIWVCGARGGFGGPGEGTYSRLAEAFRERKITSLRLDYRQPNALEECVMDVLAGVAYFKITNHEPVVLVGHSFGGAVVIAAGTAGDHVKGVVSLAPQTNGAQMVGELSPKSLLVVHGKSDSRLPYINGMQIYNMSNEPKQLVLYEGAEHGLVECRDEREELLGDWIPTTLGAPVPD